MLREVDIVDAHHHFINLPDFVYPWVESHQPVLTALLPNYYDAAHPYLPQDYRADVSAVPLAASIACEFGAADGVAEAIWVQQCADRVGVPNAFIAAVQLDSADLPDVLARYRDLPMVRAVRQPPYWAADPISGWVRAATTFAPQPGCADLSRSPTRGWYGICLYTTNSYPRLTISSRRFPTPRSSWKRSAGHLTSPPRASPAGKNASERSVSFPTSSSNCRGLHSSWAHP